MNIIKTDNVSSYVTKPMPIKHNSYNPQIAHPITVNINRKKEISRSAPTIAEIIKKNINDERAELKKMAKKKKDEKAIEQKNVKNLQYMKKCVGSLPNKTKNKKYSSIMLNNTKSDTYFYSDYESDYSDLEDEYSAFSVCDCYQGCSSCMDEGMFELDDEMFGLGDDFDNMNL